MISTLFSAHLLCVGASFFCCWLSTASFPGCGITAGRPAAASAAHTDHEIIITAFCRLTIELSQSHAPRWSTASTTAILREAHFVDHAAISREQLPFRARRKVAPGSQASSATISRKLLGQSSNKIRRTECGRQLLEAKLTFMTKLSL